MNIAEAHELLKDIEHCRLDDVFYDLPEWSNRKDPKNDANKGFIGQLLMTRLGLKNDSRILDLEDGEIKTNDVYPDGHPKESIKISQFSSSSIDTLIGPNKVAYENSKVFKKLNSCLYILKNQYERGNKLNKYKAILLPSEKWVFKKILLLQNNIKSKILFDYIESDYNYITSKIESYLNDDKVERDVKSGYRKYIFKTTNGKYLQARTAGSKIKSKKNPEGKYNRLFSSHYNKELCNKPIAIYFQANFIRDYVQGKLDKFI